MRDRYAIEAHRKKVAPGVGMPFDRNPTHEMLTLVLEVLLDLRDQNTEALAYVRTAIERTSPDA